jgi:hypothetical protein
MDIEKNSGIRRIIRAKRKVMQIHKMACRSRKMQVDKGKMRKHKERNVDIGNGT